MMLPPLPSRRDFLGFGCRTVSMIGAAAAFGKAGLMSALAQSSGDYKTLVCVFLFGGNDANNLLVPNDSSAYASYQKARQNLALPRGSLVAVQDPATKAAYGLHSGLNSLAPLYNTSKRMALLLNVGTLIQPVPRGANGRPQLSAVPLPLNLYSHSDQQTQWQSAMPRGGASTGWSGRLADKVAGTSGGRVPPAITMAGNVLQLVGQTTQPSTVSTSNFGLAAPAADPGAAALQSLLDLSSGVALIQAAQQSLKDAAGVAQAVNAALAAGGSLSVTFPATDIGNQLGQVATLIQARAALGANRQIFFCSQGGYDTHSNQLTQHATLLGNLAAALAAFDQAMGQLGVLNNVTTFTESDFGRTLQPNGSAGSDHGWGSHALILGGAVAGGSMYGTFPALTLSGPDDSTSRGTWVPSTSADQYAGALARWFGLPQADLDYVFPSLRGFQYQMPAFLPLPA
ncbi:MAG TPA: DUF1501 domain-containing protein [Bryobacteraceae bacterium]|nr:DUF1501 domain-containing protein [Bryobacteraceae bacterium]